MSRILVIEDDELIAALERDFLRACRKLSLMPEDTAQ